MTIPNAQFIADYFGDVEVLSSIECAVKDNKSLKINPNNLFWRDWGSTTGGPMQGDAFTIIQHKNSCSFAEAVKIAEKYKIRPVVEYKYKDGMKIHRIRTESGKTFRTMNKIKNAPTPLYKIDEALQHDTVCIVEGEKCADVLWSIGVPAVTSCNGASSALKSDWSPLQSKQTIIIPDCDNAGKRYADDVFSKLPQSKFIYLDGTDGYDIADYLLEGKKFSDLKIENNRDIFKPLVHPIGFSGKTVTLFDERTKQYYTFGGPDLERNISILNPQREYWMRMYPELVKNNDKSDNKIDDKDIARALIRDCQATGRNINENQTRSIGIYLDDDRVITNYGDKIFVDGNEYEFHKIKSKYFYESGGPSILITKNSDYPFEKLLERLTFETPLDIKLFIGAIFQGYLSGAINWRSHIWIVGETGSGKSEIKSKILEPAIAPIHGISRSGTLTEAAIRQLTGNKATIFLHDEAESSYAIEKELALIRESSSGGFISRGTPGHDAITFFCLNTFILLSISSSIKRASDEQRILRVYLQSTENSLKLWPETKQIIRDNFTVEYYSGIMQRAAALVKKYLESFETFKKVFIQDMKTESNAEIISRLADTYSALICGYWHWTHDEGIDEFSASVLIDEIKKSGRISMEPEDKQTTNEDMWNQLLAQQINLRGSPRTIQQIIIDRNDDVLASYGMKLKSDTEIFIRYNDKNLKKIFTEMGYSDYKNILKKRPGTQYNQLCWLLGKAQKGLVMPIDFELDKSEGSESWC